MAGARLIAEQAARAEAAAKAGDLAGARQVRTAWKRCWPRRCA